MKFARIGFLLSLVLALTNIAVANERIGDFALLDHQGRFHQLVTTVTTRLWQFW